MAETRPEWWNRLTPDEQEMLKRVRSPVRCFEEARLIARLALDFDEAGMIVGEARKPSVQATTEETEREKEFVRGWTLTRKAAGGRHG